MKDVQKSAHFMSFIGGDFVQDKLQRSALHGNEFSNLCKQLFLQWRASLYKSPHICALQLCAKCATVSTRDQAVAGAAQGRSYFVFLD